MENRQGIRNQFWTLAQSANYRLAAAFVLLVLAPILFVTFSGGGETGQRSVASQLAAPKGGTDSAVLLEFFRSTEARALEQNRIAFQMFEKELEQLRVKHSARISRASRGISGQVATYSNCSSLIYYTACDQVQGSDYTVRFLNSQISPALDGEIRLLQADLNKAVEKFAWDLRRNMVTFATDLSNSVRDDGVKVPTISLDKLAQPEFKQAMRALGTSAIGITVGLGFDVYAVWQTNLLPRLWGFVKSLVARVFARQLAVATASVSAAIIDGPLPFGDILTVGGLVWTSYDIYASRQEFEDQLEVALQANLSQAREEIFSQSLQAARNVCRQFDAQLGSVGKEILSQIEGN